MCPSAQIQQPDAEGSNPAAVASYNFYTVNCKNRLLADFCGACMYDQPCNVTVCLHGMCTAERQDMSFKSWQSKAKSRGMLNQTSVCIPVSYASATCEGGVVTCLSILGIWISTKQQQRFGYCCMVGGSSMVQRHKPLQHREAWCSLTNMLEQTKQVELHALTKTGAACITGTNFATWCITL